MKIVVCLKQVPDTETRVQIAPEGDHIAEANINWIVSPFDEYATEEALKIKAAKDKHNTFLEELGLPPLP